MSVAHNPLTERIISAIIQVHQELGRHPLDILVENKIVLELKTVEKLGKAHYAQIRSYLKASDSKIGLLVNFAEEKADFRRVDKKSSIPSSPSSPYPLFLHSG